MRDVVREGVPPILPEMGGGTAVADGSAYMADGNVRPLPTRMHERWR